MYIEALQNGLKAARLTLKLVARADLQNIHDLHLLPETDKYSTLGIPKNIEETRTIVEHWITENQQQGQKHLIFKIENAENGQFLGLLGMNLSKPKFKSAEIWYKLHSEFWKKGYATEAVTRMLDFGFDELGLHRMEAGCAVNNLASIKVLEKAGMTREGRKRKVLPLKSGWSDNFEYAILSTDRKQ